MDAILFHPETSMRRAMILALGIYSTAGLSPGEREPLADKLLDLYRNAPDAGIHGAAEWTLRKWGQQEKLKEVDADLMKQKDRGDRRWFINRQGQTFAVIDGPVEFRMGSPASEPERFPNELAHRRRIARRFAIASKEVSVAQYQKFRQENPQFVFDQRGLDLFSPYPDCPTSYVSWFGAVAYCNWLSKQEGLSENEWCYLPNEQRQYDNSMKIPGDALQRQGYRLPTEAEWEYACRAGTITSRYYGASPGLLGTYARDHASSGNHTWPGGSLLPNDFGLFDMLGNVFEWCHDAERQYDPGKGGAASGESGVSESVESHISRVIRGACFTFGPAFVRSAYRGDLAPPVLNMFIGFRVARTYN
jgi:formylglycine-generating enzyme required for sulfatase activity